MPGQFDKLDFEAPYIRLERGAKSLHFTAGEIQSSMRLDSPDALQIDYTRTMMGFLLLTPLARNISMIGLGGGSLAKFCHRHLPNARITVVENNPGVIALRHEFNIPDDDARLAVLPADGAAWIAAAPTSIDALLVDGFDKTGQPAHLCSKVFYDDCRAALAPGGVMAVNLHVDDDGHGQILQRIADSFAGNVMQVLAAERSNCIVFASWGRPVTLAALRSAAWIDGLDDEARRQLQGEFARIGWEAVPLPDSAR